MRKVCGLVDKIRRRAECLGVGYKIFVIKLKYPDRSWPPGLGCVSHWPTAETFSTDIHMHIQYGLFRIALSKRRAKKIWNDDSMIIFRKIQKEIHWNRCEKWRIWLNNSKNFSWNIEVWAVQKHVNLVDLVKSFPTNIFLQNLVSIQPITSPIKPRPEI